MTEQALHYEQIGDKLTNGLDKESAYRAAQNHLSEADKDYFLDCRRIQQKIIMALENYLGK